MKPNFALSLSFEGIKLLHRAAGGWREVGEVPVTAADLGGELAMLRKTAASLEPAGVRTKLLIPASQIKYLTIDTPGLSEAARRKEAETALHDATPYEVSELAYDISVEGPKTHVAAVARETLAEAEAFATEHRFHPVSFVAVPDEAPYLGEPFFGMTSEAAKLLEAGETVEPDGIAVVVVGAITPEFVPPRTKPESEPESTPAPAPDPVHEPKSGTETEAKTEQPTTKEEPGLEEAKAELAPVETAPTPKAAPTPVPENDPAPSNAAKPIVGPPADKTEEAKQAEAPIDTQAVPEKPAAAKPAQSGATPDSVPSAPLPTEEKPEASTPPSQPELEFAPAPAPKALPAAEKPSAKEPSAQPVKPAPEVEQPAVEAPEVVPPVSSKAPTPVAAPAAPLEKAENAPDAARAALLAAAAASGPTQQASRSSDAASRPLTANAPIAAAPPPDTAATTGFASRRNAPPSNPAAKPVGGAQRIAVRTPTPDSSSLTKPAAVVASTAAAAAPVAAAARSIGGFLSRRKPRTGPAAPLPAPTSAAPAVGTEAERMTVFGARNGQVGGKPRFLGLIMTVILLVFLAGVAAWAAVFLDDGIASLIKKDKTRATASAPENQINPEVIRTPDGIDPAQTDTTADVQIAALDPVLSAEETAVVDAAQNPRPDPQVPVITEAEAAARYAVTGIWPLAPTTPLSDPDTVDAPVYRSGIDPVSGAADAFALPAPQEIDTGVQLAAAISPPPFGQRTAKDAAGLIIPTPTGVVTPEGYTLFSASPPLKPPATLARFAAQPTVTAPQATSALAALRPQNRPLGLSERSERAQLGGVSRGELAAFRPALRPRSIQERAKEADEDALKAAEQDEARAKAAAESAAAAAAAALLVPTTPTAPAAAPTPAPIVATRFATAQSKRPDTRPRNFSRIVKRAQRAAPKQETRVAAAASVAPRTVKPSLPSKASVARSATVKNAINLRKVNLIGIYGKPSSRRALVRLGNGRYQKVKVGDRIDGGRVASISNSELRYSKSGRNVVLKMP
ncbi:hypothetical protein [uncultured Sulfitobacter sp.]|uniref:hypothetical protein n=1 Tax=uncultured Sulfitobacter sp. TaxID=191468 RepID=UPI0026054DBA|nr:hypothetical protein [uncultured Sulfitobacter sp.]